MSDRPNIVLVMTDQMRSTALGCAGREPVITPNLDRFAGEGVRFTNAVSNTPACTPARATLLTGKHVFSHGLISNDLPLATNHTSVAHGLNTAGYCCAWIGKWHVDGVNRGAFIPPERRQGFNDFWAGIECNHQYLDGYYYDDQTREPVWFDGYEPDGQTDLACKYLSDRTSADKPFFLAVSWGPPHCPYHLAPDDTRAWYDPDLIPIMPNAREATVQDPAYVLKRGSRPLNLSQAEHDRRKRLVIRDYYAHVSALDRCFGRLMTTIDELGLRDDTIVIFTSDHGDMLFSQNRGWKSKPWRESVGIPLLVRWPGHAAPGRVSNAPVGLVDLMPTLVSIGGGTVPAEVEGNDLTQLLLGDETAAPESQYINFPCPAAMFRDPAWRGVVTRNHTYVTARDRPWLLYDDVADPVQMHNLVGLVGTAEIQDSLDLLVRGWLERTGDEFEDPSVIADRYLPGHVDHILWGDGLVEPVKSGQAKRREARGAAVRTRSWED
jgi:arylsulfatase A-like enzyme